MHGKIYQIVPAAYVSEAITHLDSDMISEAIPECDASQRIDNYLLPEFSKVLTDLDGFHRMGKGEFLIDKKQAVLKDRYGLFAADRYGEIMPLNYFIKELEKDPCIRYRLEAVHDYHYCSL
jgi:hypothetical protein